MAKRKRPSPRPAAAAPTGGARRLGGEHNSRPGPSASAQRRIDRKRSARSRQLGWAAVVVVVVAVLVIVLTNVLGSSSSSGDSNGDNPTLAPASIVRPLETIPASVFDAVGTDGQTLTFSTPKSPPHLYDGTKPEFVYFGAEYCPYCAVMRYALIAALSRFGSFSGIKEMTSSSTDTIQNVPTYSFLGATYTSKYVEFMPTEYANRDDEALQTPTKAIDALVTKYDNPPYVGESSATGIPFLDIAGKYYSSGVSSQMQAQAIELQNGGPGRAAIVQGMTTPTSAIGKGVSASITIAQANFISAAICATDGSQPAAVCHSSGVEAAARSLAKASVYG